MKLLNALFLGLSLTVLVSCGGNPVVGKWKLDDINQEKALKKLPKADREMAIKFKDMMLEANKGKIKLNVEEKGKLTIESPNQDGTTNSQKGKWTLSDDKKAFTTDVKGEKQSFKVIEVSDKKFVLQADGEDVEMIFVH